MQCSSNWSQMVHAHDEHRWHSSLTCSHASQIYWLEYNWDHSLPIRPGSIPTSINTHFCPLYDVFRHLHSVCLSSYRISLHSSMSSQWLSITSLIRWPLRPDLLSHHINPHIMHAKVRLSLHWSLACCGAQSPFLDVRGDHLCHRNPPYVNFGADSSFLIMALSRKP